MVAQAFELFKPLASDIKRAIKRIKSKISFMKIEEAPELHKDKNIPPQ